MTQQEKKPRVRSYPATEKMLYTLVHLENCLAIDGKLDIQPLPLVRKGVGQWAPGTKFTQLASKKKSAGFPHYEFTDPYPPLEYLGIHRDLDGMLAVFRAPNCGPDQWFAYHYYPEQGLIWGTSGCAGRVIELTDCLPPPEPL